MFSNQSNHEISDLKMEKMKLDESLSFCHYSELTLKSQVKLAQDKLNDTQAELDDKQLDLHKCQRDYDISTGFVKLIKFTNTCFSDDWADGESAGTGRKISCHPG